VLSLGRDAVMLFLAGSMSTAVSRLLVVIRCAELIDSLVLRLCFMKASR
jgi:hypothetical protein